MSSSEFSPNAHVRDQLERKESERALRAAARAGQRARDELLLAEHERIAAAFASARYGIAELNRARDQVGKWVRDGTCSRWYAKRWSQILSGSPEEVAAQLRMLDSEDRMALVQNTPFGFLLAEKVRG